MKLLRIAALALCLAALALCMFTDRKDGLYLPMALCLSMAGNGINVLSAGREKCGREKEK